MVMWNADAWMTMFTFIQAPPLWDDDRDDLQLLLQDESLCHIVGLTPALAEDATTVFEALAVNFLWEFGVSMEQGAQDPKYADYTLDATLRSTAALGRTRAVLQAYKQEDEELMRQEEADVGLGATQRFIEAVTLAVPMVQSMASALTSIAGLVTCARPGQLRISHCKGSRCVCPVGLCDADAHEHSIACDVAGPGACTQAYDRLCNLDKHNRSPAARVIAGRRTRGCASSSAASTACSRCCASSRAMKTTSSSNAKRAASSSTRRPTLPPASRYPMPQRRSCSAQRRRPSADACVRTMHASKPQTRRPRARLHLLGRGGACCSARCAARFLWGMWVTASQIQGTAPPVGS
jgi:hypothetical protein